MTRLNWEKNEQRRRMRRFGTAPVGLGPAPSEKRKKRKKKNKGRKHAGRYAAGVRAAPAKPPIDQSELNAPNAFERFRQEVADLDRQIAGLENLLLERRRRRAAVVAALKKIAPPGRIHAEKLIPAAEAVGCKMGQRRKPAPNSHSNRAASGT